MADGQEVVEPSSVWFLYTESGEPLGQVYRSGGEAVPTTGVRLSNGAKWRRIVVADFTELTSTCAMRRFRVVVRLIE